MLPLLGPSNPRDAVGRVVDMLFDPLTYVGLFAVSNIGSPPTWVMAWIPGPETSRPSTRFAGLVDYYATIRSLYRQHRNDEINNSKTRPMAAPTTSRVSGVLPRRRSRSPRWCRAGSR
jgi:phospholipid-binding lipoprotein MlaA